MSSGQLPLSYDLFYKDDAYTKIRRIKLLLFSGILQKHDGFKKKRYMDKMEVLKSIEFENYKNAIHKTKASNSYCDWDNAKFINLYHFTCSKSANILDYLIESKDMSNTQLQYLKDFVDGKGTNNLLTMSPETAYLGEYKDILKKIEQRNLSNIKIKYSTQYKCGKCKKSKCTTRRRYNRSLDEGVNLTVICVFCGNTWNA
jgi:DNA-directed RNA polymerase subunit M/transcription elongation factor TFIIS